ncbi:MAG: hypothetical protein J0H57_04225, partial [Rhodospirillales bacterium]|nr:hypothetical protein [Rhodospirillales bacterium]
MTGRATRCSRRIGGPEPFRPDAHLQPRRRLGHAVEGEPDACSLHGAARKDPGGEKVDRRVADEGGDGEVVRPIVEHPRLGDLLEPPLHHHRDAARNAHRLGLVMGDEDDREAG